MSGLICPGHVSAVVGSGTWDFIAREYGIPLPSTAVSAQLFNAMLQMDMGGLDNSAVVGVLEVLANTRLLEE